jgi:signal transduction histidine kinase
MKKSIWIFLFAVLLPGIVLGWLALRSAEEQQIIFERRTAELYQKETEHLAAAAREAVEAERRAFGDVVHKLLARNDADALAKDFSYSLLDAWPSRRAVGFAVGRDGRMVSPTTSNAAKNPQLKSFMWDNLAFISGKQSSTVYVADTGGKSVNPSFNQQQIQQPIQLYARAEEMAKAGKTGGAGLMFDEQSTAQQPREQLREMQQSEETRLQRESETLNKKLAASDPVATFNLQAETTPSPAPVRPMAVAPTLAPANPSGLEAPNAAVSTESKGIKLQSGVVKAKNDALPGDKAAPSPPTRHDYAMPAVQGIVGGKGVREANFDDQKVPASTPIAPDQPTAAADRLPEALESLQARSLKLEPPATPAIPAIPATPAPLATPTPQAAEPAGASQPQGLGALQPSAEGLAVARKRAELSPAQAGAPGSRPQILGRKKTGPLEDGMKEIQDGDRTPAENARPPGGVLSASQPGQVPAEKDKKLAEKLYSAPSAPASPLLQPTVRLGTDGRGAGSAQRDELAAGQSNDSLSRFIPLYTWAGIRPKSDAKEVNGFSSLNDFDTTNYYGGSLPAPPPPQKPAAAASEADQRKLEAMMAGEGRPANTVASTAPAKLGDAVKTKERQSLQQNSLGLDPAPVRALKENDLDTISPANRGFRAPASAQAEIPQIHRTTVNDRNVMPLQNPRPPTANWSSALPENTNFGTLTANGAEEGMFARFVQDKLDLIFWIRPPEAPEMIFGCLIESVDLQPLWNDLLANRADESGGNPPYILALLDDRAHAVTMYPKSDKPREWKRPFVASEIGDMLPHWEAALYLATPTALIDTARGFRRTLSFTIAAAIALIALGGWLVVADVRRQLALAQQKTDFVSNVSHELKTPLTSIRMFAELMHDRPQAAEKQGQYLRIITVEAERLTRLINNVLDFAKLERRQKRFDKRSIDLHCLITRVWEGQEMHLRDAGFTTNWEAAPPPYPVVGDEDALAQILVNLLSNAEKYSQERKDVELVSWLEEGWMNVSVLDRGMGVPDGEEQKIFEAFYRAHDSLSSGIQGSGLGLTLAQRLAHEQGGKIIYEPRQDGGSRFTLRLPLARGQEKEDHSQEP